jgi:hypothetical protein
LPVLGAYVGDDAVGVRWCEEVRGGGIGGLPPAETDEASAGDARGDAVVAAGRTCARGVVILDVFDTVGEGWRDWVGVLGELALLERVGCFRDADADGGCCEPGC